ncbi:hypothetical protein [Magnetospirillum fulvum]|uniref:Uncharacterized protein n=1 Tax=Magnetospirillum fulvum MGU-K5 TaxID=1316936 RepID=S9SHD7_MAGFU|nr:hypothetical protein [Magnetospirillum fulvum]EPY03523.1 hypothetical protein K678_00390 [Magnetospirillum fulvum MGU-K5]
MADPNTAADLVIYPLEDLGGLIRTAFHSGDPARPGLEVCEIAHHLPTDERRRLSALFATAPDLSAENERIRALYLEAERALTDALTENGRLRDLKADLVEALGGLAALIRETASNGGHMASDWHVYLQTADNALDLAREEV